jgi:hypothetical protein
VGAPEGVPLPAPFRYLGGPLRSPAPAAGSVERAVTLTLAYAASLARAHAAEQRRVMELEARLREVEAELQAVTESTPMRVSRALKAPLTRRLLGPPLRGALRVLEGAARRRG